ncbi:hypothetical protein [Yinghuangia seranimata]|uniref:hypothetical protein n=1 Tax=Yinghuangia seranimata TaxID=408067 RepID=UPI00248AD34D|nr:hypothetical protein [Yinghuangia seranimata]MDI2128605.1 hypothetical protein [Yinghuangia seranimata]
MNRLVVLASVVAVLAVVAAVVAFVNGSWLGVPFLLLAGLDGNLAFLVARRKRDAARAAARA